MVECEPMKITAYGAFLLARSFHQGGDLLGASPGHLATSGPVYFLYHHAIEGYLITFLRIQGKEPEQMKDYMHRFGRMLEDCQKAGLSVSTKTERFIRKADDQRDHVRFRYELRDSNAPWKVTGVVAAALELETHIRAAMTTAGYVL